MKTARLPVTAANSTVLGCGARSKYFAKMWNELDWTGVRKDGGQHIFNLAGGEYLHVKVLYDEEEDGAEAKDDPNCRRWYRVRPAFYPGRKYRGCRVVDVKVRQVDGKWYWELCFEAQAVA